MEKKSKKSTAKPTRKRVSRPKSRGLGDTIEKVTEATGIKKVVEKVSDALGVDCGCETRKNWLNERFRYRNIECMTHQQAANWPESMVRKKRLTNADMEFIAAFHADLFKHKIQKPCTCSPSEWRRMINDIDEMYQAYKQDNATS